MAKVRVALLVAATAFFTWNLRAPEKAPAPAPERVIAPDARPATAPAPQAAAPAAPTARTESPGPLDTLRERVRALNETDQPGLDRLYQDAAEQIRENEPGVLHAIEDSFASLLESRLEEGFFVVSAWMRSSSAPVSVLRVIWSQAPQGVEAISGHRGPLIPAERHRRIEAYALRELRRLLEARKLGFQTGEAKELVADIAQRAGQVKSLNVGLEAFQLLATLGARAEIQSALMQRSEEERVLIHQVLKS